MAANMRFSNMESEDFEAHKAKILAIGCGGAGNNTITSLTEKNIKGATTVAINTDAKHLSISKANQKLLIGRELTKGLGAGGYRGHSRCRLREGRAGPLPDGQCRHVAGPG